MGLSNSKNKIYYEIRSIEENTSNLNNLNLKKNPDKNENTLKIFLYFQLFFLPFYNKHQM